MKISDYVDDLDYCKYSDYCDYWYWIIAIISIILDYSNNHNTHNNSNNHNNRYGLWKKVKGRMWIIWTIWIILANFLDRSGHAGSSNGHLRRMVPSWLFKLSYGTRLCEKCTEKHGAFLAIQGLPQNKSVQKMNFFFRIELMHTKLVLVCIKFCR